MTTIFICPGKYIAGIFRDDDAASAYLASMPAGRWEVLRVAFEYPFIVIERHGHEGAEFQVVAPGNLRCGPGTLYEINMDYVPPVPWGDWMGSLPHVHAEEDDEDDGLQVGEANN